LGPHRGEQILGVMPSVVSDCDEDDAVAPRSDSEPLGAMFGMNRERGPQVPGRIRTGAAMGAAVPARGPAPVSGLSAAGNVEVDDGPEGLAAPTELPALTGALA
jgi:hypothetical protein